MLTCIYCGGIVKQGETDCPHCGSSLVEVTQDKVQKPEASEIQYVFSPVYHRWLVFWQNAIIVIIVSYFIAIFYLMPPAISAFFIFEKHPIRAFGIVYCFFPLLYYLAILTMLGFYKKTAMQKKFTLKSDMLEYTYGTIKKDYPTSSIADVQIKQGPRQAKYKVGTVSLRLNVKNLNNQIVATKLEMKNIEQPDVIYSKLLALKNKHA